MINNIIKKITNKPNQLLLIIYFIMAIILPLIWLKGNFLFVGEEINFSNYQDIIHNNLYSWSSGLNFGEPSAHWNHSLIIPNGIIYYLLSMLTIPNFIIQKIFLSIIIFTILASISYFIKLFTQKTWLIFAGSLFYFLNFYTASSIFYSAKMYQLILMPLLFTLVYRYLKENKSIYIFYNFLAVFLLQAIFTNLPQAITTFFVYILAVLFFIYENQMDIEYFYKKYFRKLVLFFLPIITIFIYQLLLLYFSVFQFSEVIGQSKAFTAFTSSIIKIFELRGSWWENDNHLGVAYSHLNSFYNNPIIIIISWLIILPIFLKLYNIFKDKYSKYNFWFIASFITLIFTDGFSFYPPVYHWLYNNVPYFYFFREPWAKFFPILLFLLTILLIISIKKWSKKLVWLIILLILIRGLPFFSINFFDRNNIDWKKEFIKIPQYWEDYFDWTKNNKDSAVLTLPYYSDSSDSIMYKWYKKDMGNSNLPVHAVFGENNSVFHISNYSSIDHFSKILENFSKEENDKFIYLAPINYLLDQQDLDMNYRNTTEEYNNQSSIKKYFNQTPMIEFSNKLPLYEIKDEYRLPKFYPAQNIISSLQVDSLLPTVLLSNEYTPKTAIYYMPDFNKINNQYNLSNLDIKQFSIGFSSAKTKMLDKNNENLYETILEITKLQNIKTINGKLSLAEQQQYNSKIMEKKKLKNELSENKFGLFDFKINNIFDKSENVVLEVILKNNKVLKNQNNNFSILKMGNSQIEISNSQIRNFSNGKNVIIENPKLPKGELISSSDDFVLGGLILVDKSLSKITDNLRDVSIEYKKINPTKYKLSIKNAKENFPLVFNEDYSRYWKLYLLKLSEEKVNPTTVFKKPVNENSHLMVNGFANSWIITPDGICKDSNICQKNDDGSYDLELIIEYQPQKYFTSLMILNILILITALIYISIYRLKNKGEDFDD